MKRNFWIKQLSLAVMAAGLLAMAIAWQTHPGRSVQTSNDTVPDRYKKIRDIDDALEELERSKAEVDRSLKDIDWQKIDRDIKASVDKIHINTEEIKAEIDRAVKEIDVEKIQVEVQNAVKAVDVEKIQANI